jgi:hypothetical protein
MKMILNKGKVGWSYALSYKVKMTILCMNRTAKKASSPQPSPPACAAGAASARRRPEEEREKAYGDLCATICLPRPARNERGEGLFQGSPKPGAISFFFKGVVV